MKLTGLLIRILQLPEKLLLRPFNCTLYHFEKSIRMG